MRFIVTLLTVVLIGTCTTTPCNAATVDATTNAEWSLDVSLSSSTEENVDLASLTSTSLKNITYGAALTYTTSFLDDNLLAITLPWQWSHSSREQYSFVTDETISAADHESELLLPTARVSFRPEISPGTLRGDVTLGYNPNDTGLELVLGVESLRDPLLSHFSLFKNGRDKGLNGGVIFAANEKWALGTHLAQTFHTYGMDSFITYQMFYTHRSGQTTEMYFTHKLADQAGQLGLKFTF